MIKVLCRGCLSPGRVGTEPGMPCAFFGRTHPITLMMALCIPIDKHEHRWASGPSAASCSIWHMPQHLQPDMQHRPLHLEKVLVSSAADLTGACEMLADT